MQRSPAQEYAAKRAAWLDALAGEHPNSIRVQISLALRDAAFFGMVRDLAAEDPAHEINGHFLELFQNGYYVRQSLAVRRLVDRRADVHSLFRVVTDIRRERHLLTREHYVGFGGIPWRLRETYEAMVGTMLVEEGEQAPKLDPVKLQHYMDAKRNHGVFDRLSDGGEGARDEPNDRMAIRVFDKLLADMESPSIQRVVQFTHKFAAHAARDVDALDASFRPTRGDVEDALKRLSQIYAFLRSHVLHEASTTLVPEPQYDNLKALASPLVPLAHASEARDFWRRQKKTIDNWVTGEDCYDRFYAK